MLVFDPFIDRCSIFTDTAGVPSRVTRFKQDTHILLPSIALTSKQHQISVKTFKLRNDIIYILCADSRRFMEVVPGDPFTPRFNCAKAALVKRNHFSPYVAFFTVTRVQQKLYATILMKLAIVIVFVCILI